MDIVNQIESSNEPIEIPDIENQLDPDIVKMQELNKQEIKPKYVKLTNEEKPIGISGLANLGNTCYMNSILQCLFNIGNFKNEMNEISILKELYNNIVSKLSDENKNNYSTIINNTNYTITFQLYKLFEMIWKNNNKEIEPVKFKKLFGIKINSFQNFEQQDAQEALMCILDTMHTELAGEIDISYNIFPEKYLEIFKIIEEQNISEIDCCRLECTHADILELHSLKKAIDRYNKKSYSIITKYFQNIISSTLQCPECNFHTFNFDPSIMLSIQIPIEQCIDMHEINEQISRIQGAPSEILQQIKSHLIRQKTQEQVISLEQCLYNFHKVEVLDDDEQWHCPNCHIKVKASKKMDIWVPSKVLIIHIKRFDYQGNKINNLITFPINELNINKYMSEYSTKLGNFTYDLFAVSNHRGSIHGGHYYSFVKSLTDTNWYCVNDNDVIKIDETKIVSNDAYILFYKLRE